MSTPQVSVVIPTYNRANYIAEAIESVLEQKGDFKPEIIVVDDGSTDNTEAIVKKYKGNVKYFKISHSGLPAVVRNYGISKASGELIALQDSDDLWVPNKLAIQLPVFNDPSVVISYGNAVTIDSTGNPANKTMLDSSKLKAGEKFEDLVKDNVISTLTTVFRRGAFKQLGGFSESKELRAIEDYELWLRFAASFPGGIKHIAKPLAHYRVHEQNISDADALMAVERLLNVYNSLWESELSDKQRDALESQLFNMHENWSRLKNEAGETPAISVIMGLYKDESFVKKAVQSILDQEFNDFEFIIVDDGAKDKSAEIVAKIKDPRIRLIHQTNHGLVNVLNKGVRLARASLVARQDADDISLPERFTEELKLMNPDEKIGVVGTFFKYVDEQTLKPTGITIAGPTKPIDLARNLYFNNPVGHGTALIKKQAILEAGGYSDKYGPNEDYFLWHKIVAAGWKITIAPEVHYLYRLSSQSISRSNEEQQHRLFSKLVNDIWKGPIYFKPFWRIIADNSYYKRLDSPFRSDICAEYKSHQIKLTFEFLLRGHLLNGYNNFIGALILYPKGALKLWPTLAWAPIKYLKERL